MTTQTEALKLALESMKRIDAWLIQRGYTGLMPQEKEVITSIESALAQQEPWCMKMNGCKTKCEDCPVEVAQQEPKFWYDEEEGLLHDHFNDLPLGCIPLYTTPPQRTEERNFCSRCGKRTADLTVIHTCTPPQPEQEPVAWATRMGEYAHIHWGAKRPEYPMVYEAPLYATPPQRKPLTDEQKDILNFLFGLRAIDDVWFGDKHPTERGQYWWRNRLRKAFQEAAHGIKENA